MQEKRKGPSVGAGVVAIKQLYENNVAIRALKRAGRNKNLKGHILPGFLTRRTTSLL